MSRKTAMAELEALLMRCESNGCVDVEVTFGMAHGKPRDVVALAVADVRAILNKARFADRVNESKSSPNRRQ
jgi:hypothetical protein